ncbi:MAG: DUF2029 domain-containing protein [Candidatus Obscuribacter sp.]|nr:DUF2029 domain-containing protein [Candidatus Obscuribacter sp.]
MHCLALKPQMLVPAVFVLALSLFQKRFSALLGFVLGGATLIAVNYFVMGQKAYSNLFECLKLSDKIYSDPHSVSPVKLAHPCRGNLLALPADSRAMCKPLVTASLLLLLAGIALSIALLIQTVKDEDKTRLSLITGCLACLVWSRICFCMTSACWLRSVGWLFLVGLKAYEVWSVCSGSQ